MQRTIILGNTAGGKSTLGRKLADKRGLRYVEIDSLFWQADWSVVPNHEYMQKHNEIIDQVEWIVDGVGSMESLYDRAERATELILIDMPLWTHFWLAAERQIAWSNGTIKHQPAGNHEMPPTRRLFEIIWENDKELVPKMRALCDKQETLGKAVTRLRSVEEIDAFGDSGYPR